MKQLIENILIWAMSIVCTCLIVISFVLVLGFVSAVFIAMWRFTIATLGVNI